jgi:ABC-2 type transport system ATP-binding protein
VLDEPTAGIDPLLRRRLWDHFRELRDEGRTILVTTQYVDEAANCDTVVVLVEGSVVAIGTPEELRRRAFPGDATRADDADWDEIFIALMHGEAVAR